MVVHLENRVGGRRPQKFFSVYYKGIQNSESEKNGASIREYKIFFGFSALYKGIQRNFVFLCNHHPLYVFFGEVVNWPSR